MPKAFRHYLTLEVPLSIDGFGRHLCESMGLCRMMIHIVMPYFSFIFFRYLFITVRVIAVKIFLQQFIFWEHQLHLERGMFRLSRLYPKMCSYSMGHSLQDSPFLWYDLVKTKLHLYNNMK